MDRKRTPRIQRGQAITFRLPADTPDHIIKQLQKLKETEKRNFSSKIAEFAIEGVNKTLAKEKETITIPLPKQLTKEQRDWLKHAHSEAMLGTIIYQLLADPIRASALLATLNSSSLDIDEALYLQENVDMSSKSEQEETTLGESTAESNDSFEENLDQFDWEKALAESSPAKEEPEEEENADDLLGDFLAKMNQ